MTTYAACCCVGDETVPCGNQDSTLQCEPEAIVVEGRVVYGVDIGSYWLETRDASCGLCGSLDEANLNRQENIYGTKYAVISFKALLLRGGGNILNGDALGSVYGTETGASAYGPVASLQAFMSGGFSYTYKSTEEGCQSVCSGLSIDETRLREINQSRDEPRLNSFQLTRRVSQRECGSSRWNGCLNESLGPGCYETFDFEANIEIPTEVTQDYRKVTSAILNDGFGNCYESILVDDRESSVLETNFESSIQITRYAEIAIDQTGVTDACPQDSPREFTAMFVPSFGAVNDPFDGCYSAQPCECGHLSRIGYQGSYPDAGPNAISLASGVVEIAALADPCRGLRFAETSIETDYYTVNEILNCGQASTSCAWDNVNAGDFDTCSVPLPSTDPRAIRSRGGTSNMQTNASFVITRHELLYSLPDPADWPQNV